MVADLWFYWIGHGHLNEGRTWSQLAWNRLQRFDLPADPRLLWTLAWNLLITGETSSAEGYLAECLVQAEQVDDARSVAYARALLAGVQFFQGDYERSFEMYGEALAESRRQGDDFAVAMFTYELALAHCSIGQYDIAQEYSLKAIEICTHNSDRWCLAYARWVQALTAFGRGSRDQAEESAREALTLMASVDNHLGIALIGELWAWMAAEARDYRSAAAFSGATEAYWTEMGCAVMGIPALLDTRERFRQATAEHLPARSLAAARAAGASQDLAWITEQLTDHAPRVTPDAGRPAAAKPALENLAFLTEREREIAALIVRGLTNQDIAETLVIGKRTVDTHVGHILAKCGARRRGELIPLLFNLSEGNE